MKTHIIGLTGYADAGKDTAADLLCTHAGFRKMAFGDALRGEICGGFSVSLDIFLDRTRKHQAIAALCMRRAPHEFLAAVALAMDAATDDHRRPLSDEWLDAPRSPRQIMQWWGTQYRRAQNPRYWTGIVLAKLNFYRRDGETRFVIADCRYPNEADTVRAVGGRIWQITRPGLDGSTTAEGTHDSATDGARLKPDAVIANGHDIRHLQQLVLSEYVALETGIPGAKVTVPV